MHQFNQEHRNPDSPWAFSATPPPLRMGRRRDTVQCPTEPTVHFSLPSQVVLLPEFDKDPRYKFSSSRSIPSRKGGFSVGLGHFSISLPVLQAMREQQAEVCHVHITQSLFAATPVVYSKIHSCAQLFRPKPPRLHTRTSRRNDAALESMLEDSE